MEKRVFRVNGFLMLLLLIVAAAATTWYVIDAAQGLADEAELPGVAIAVLVTAIVLGTIALTGFTIVNPNQARVIQFFGRYIGSIKRAGFHWTVPLTERTKVSLRVRNFETERLKVADGDGNPVEIAAVVVWRVVDSANAIFAVDDHVEYVAVQAETAVRHLATTYPYETHGTGRAEPARQRHRQPGAHQRAAANGSSSPGSRSSSRASPTSRTPRRSPRPCSPASRPTLSSPPASRSSRAPSAW